MDGPEDELRAKAGDEPESVVTEDDAVESVEDAEEVGVELLVSPLLDAPTVL
jgi:hypothetical protein